MIRERPSPRFLVEKAGASASRRRAIFGLSLYPIAPATYGGQIRVHNLGRVTARFYDLTFYSQHVTVERLRRKRVVTVAPDFVDLQCNDVFSSFAYVFTRTIGIPQLFLTSTLHIFVPSVARRRMREADIIVIEQPWLFRWARRHARAGQAVVLATHNVEADMFPIERIRLPRPLAVRVRRLIERQEHEAVHGSDLVTVTTPEDRARLASLYAIDPARIAVVPNGVDATEYRVASPAEREGRKEELGLGGKRVIVFVGGTHPPNVAAVRRILAWARDWPDDRTHFLIVGGIGRKFPGANTHNVTFTNVVDDVRPYLACADLAVNPIGEGSGVNLKQLEAMAAGLPSVTTPFGARGLPIVDGVHARVVDPGEIPVVIRQLLDDPDATASLGRNARALVETDFEWTAIGARLAALYDATIAAKTEERERSRTA